MLLRRRRRPQARRPSAASRHDILGRAVSRWTHLTALGVATTVLEMVPDLPAQLARMDQRFDGLDTRLDSVDGHLNGFDTRLAGVDRRLDGLDARFDGIDRRLDAVDARFDAVDARFDAVDRRLEELSERMDSHAVETRRHFDVVAESLVSQIRLVAEGVLTVDRKVDRVADELRGELVRVNRRMLTLSARIPPKRRR
jgi:septal ring factor EnvC (AmiA/AmiB activator)